MIRADQLPVAVQRRLGVRPAAGRRPAGRSVTSGGQWTCVCGQTFTTWAAVQRHSAPGHRRFAIPLDGAR